MKKSKQRITRNRNNADMRFELAIIAAPEQLRLYPKPQKPVKTSADRNSCCQVNKIAH
jgi:hypothetical protein